MSLYSDYVKEREKKNVIENEHGFVKYKIDEKDKYMYLEDMYIRPESRGKGFSKKMTDFLCLIAKDKGCTKLITSVVPSAENSHKSLLVILKYGGKLRSAYNDIIYFEKDL